ncbi:hypothetical protein F4805DRAFT_393442 [Annulohypoxylon moriforme]|nr:hypothetical protein F4805DRAFT_393442 [Annulohypoxylon moriforme]
MPSRYPRRNRAAVDYAAVAAGKAQAIRIPEKKKPGRPSQTRTPKPKAPKTKNPNVRTRWRSPRGNEWSARQPGRPEPEPLDQNSDGGPDTPSPDPDVDPDQLSDTTPTESQDSAEKEVEEESSEPSTAELPRTYPGINRYRARHKQLKVPDSMGTTRTPQFNTHQLNAAYYNVLLPQESDDASSPSTVSESEDETNMTTQEYHDRLARREMPSYETSSESDFWEMQDQQGADGLMDSFSEIDMEQYRPMVDPMTELTIQGIVDMVGAVTFFAQNVQRMRIDVTSPMSVMMALNSQDSLWDAPHQAWVKYADRAWRHRFHIADKLYDMELGDLVTLADVAMKFKEDLSAKGIEIML